jgi:Mg2+ and Co2+ transporter CorA
MIEPHTRCPVCNATPKLYSIDSTNLEFLANRAAEQKINAAISLGKIVWENLPTLRLTADSKAIIEDLSKVVLKNLEEQVSTVLQSFGIFMETFPPLLEKLPDDLRKDFQEKFETTRMTLEGEFKALREVTPTFQSVIESIETVTERIENATSKKMDEVKVELGGKFREVLEEMGFPPVEQVKLLTQLVASSLPVLEELLRIQKVPGEKGRRGEMELLDELNNFFPEDEYQHLGTSGETDLVASVKHDGNDLGYKVLIESKKNASGWKRDYVLQVQRHMTNSRERFAILAVDVLPKGADGFFIERCSEGMIFVTSRENFKITYGALRSVLIALYPFRSGTVDLKRLLADKRIEDAIKGAYQYQDNVKRIRQKAGRIVTNAEEITKNANALDDHLKQCLKELQRRISEAVQQIEDQNEANE